jgi:hypothetical protein
MAPAVVADTIDELEAGKSKMRENEDRVIKMAELRFVRPAAAGLTRSGCVTICRRGVLAAFAGARVWV